MFNYGQANFNNRVEKTDIGVCTWQCRLRAAVVGSLLLRQDTPDGVKMDRSNFNKSEKGNLVMTPRTTPTTDISV